MAEYKSSPAQLKNLEKRKRFGKDRPPAKSPGRPKRADLVEALRETYCDNLVNMRRLIRQAEKKHTDMIFHYVSGKPVERIDLSGELKHAVDPNLIAAAQVAIKHL